MRSYRLGLGELGQDMLRLIQASTSSMAVKVRPPCAVSLPDRLSESFFSKWN
jgi:hypothetical protein